MGVFRQFPYSNFHDMNMDEIIKIVRDMLDAWVEYKAKLDVLYDDVSSAFSDFTDEFNTFLNNKEAAFDTEMGRFLASKNAQFDAFINSLDAEAAFRQALDSMVADGTIANIMRPIVASTAAPIVSEWLAENIQQPTTPPLDKSLSVANAAAESAAVGDFWTETRALTVRNLLDYIPKTDRVAGGVTFEWHGNNCHVTGTATTNTFVNIFASPSSMPPYLGAGAVLYCGNWGGSNCALQIFYFKSDGSITLLLDSSTPSLAVYNQNRIVIPADAVGLQIRLYVASGVTVSEAVTPYIAREMTNSKLTTQFERAITINPIQGDCATYINYMFNFYERIHLAAGIYPITNQINIPYGKTLEGDGEGTVIESRQAMYNSIILNNGATIKNMRITRYEGLTSRPDHVGNFNAILMSGLANSHVTIADLVIDGFDGRAIYLHQNGGGTTPHWIRNCFVLNCGAGIYIDESEYNQITNCTFWQCYNGAYDNGGNNKYIGCGFDSCAVGMQLTPLYANNTHGLISGCSFNHNTSYGLFMGNVTNGMIIANCQIHFATLRLGGVCTGLVFTGCHFGNQIEFIFEASHIGYNILNGCTFYNDPTFTVTNWIRGFFKLVECFNMRTGETIASPEP